MEIKDKVIIVTGASQGIGLATVGYLANLGAKMVLAARSEDIIKKLEKELPGSLAVKTDMRETDDIKNLIDETMKKYGRIDVLVNNAGQGMYGPVEKIDIDNFRDIMELNVYSIVSAMQMVIPIMRAQGGGTILNVSSRVTKMCIPQLAAYSATKYALNAVSFIAREELASDNIVVSVMHPKMTATNFTKNAIGERPNFIVQDPNLSVDEPIKVAERIGELIRSGEREAEM